jgi:NADP-dependent 3-hydroxy acid dehydrogenase YdfG
MVRFAPHPERRPTVVTGASSGIGQATASALAALGHPVVLGARRVDQCEKTADTIRRAGGTATALPLDLSDADSVESFARAATEVLGDIEILVSNAAQNIPGSALDTDSATFEGVLGVNVNGTHRLIRALLPAMVGRQRGDIAFITSDVVERPRPTMAAYVASKWGLEGYARSLQMELEGTGVRATIVRPGPTLTGMGMDWGPDMTAEVLNGWVAWGFARHDNFMRPAGVAQAIVAAVTLPRGTHATVVELQPEAPLREPGDTALTDTAPSNTAPNNAAPNNAAANNQEEP